MSVDFTRTVHIGSIPSDRVRGTNVFVTVRFHDGRLSLTGVEGPMPSGDCHGGAGQIVMSWNNTYLDAFTFARGWDRVMVERLRDVWNTWHLNDMQAGTPRQTGVLRAHVCGTPDCKTLRQSDRYAHDKSLLASLGLDPDRDHDDYSYGSAWLTIEVPESVLEWLGALPTGEKVPAWA